MSDDVGQIATPGAIGFWRYYDAGSLLIAGVVMTVERNGRVNTMSEFGNGVHNSIGVREVVILPQTQSGFDFRGAVAALERRGKKRFRSVHTAKTFLARFHRVTP